MNARRSYPIRFRPTPELLEARTVPSALLPPTRVHDINPGPSSSMPNNLVDRNGTLFFAAGDSNTGMELWKSDGTHRGTVRVKDINPGPADSRPDFLTVVNGVLYFAANDGSNGVELWRSDGTEAGTWMVADINPRAASSNPMYLINFKGMLFFNATDGANGGELWKSNGTAAGTVLVQDINPGPADSYPTQLTVVNGISSSTLFFTAIESGPSRDTGRELWKSDGTAATLVKDIWLGPRSSFPSNLTKVGTSLFFGADNGVLGRELWKSNGTPAGTVLVKDINPGPGSSMPTSSTALMTDRNGQLLFAADEDGGLRYGQELWRSNGTASGTQRVMDIYPGIFGSGPSTGLVYNGVVYFGADNGRLGGELWRSDGTRLGTRMVKDIYPGIGSGLPLNRLYAAVYGGKIYFAANDPDHNRELWESNGTTAGTKMVKDIWLGAGPSSPEYFTVSNNILFFAANDGVKGKELWRFPGLQPPISDSPVPALDPTGLVLAAGDPTLAAPWASVQDLILPTPRLAVGGPTPADLFFRERSVTADDPGDSVLDAVAASSTALLAARRGHRSLEVELPVVTATLGPGLVQGWVNGDLGA